MVCRVCGAHIREGHGYFTALAVAHGSVTVRVIPALKGGTHDELDCILHEIKDALARGLGGGRTTGGTAA